MIELIRGNLKQDGQFRFAVNRESLSSFLTAIFNNGVSSVHSAQAIGQGAIQQGHRVLYRESHALLDDLELAKS